MLQQKPTDIRAWYDGFNQPITDVDCGTKCAPNNPSGKPFCCDICHAVPAVYAEEWDYLCPNTDLWRPYTGRECTTQTKPTPPSAPENMILLACLGPDQCQRDFRAISCRQFPFFPYITSDFRFIGLACEWTFETSCWVIQNLDRVTSAYRQEFVAFYDKLFNLKMQEMESYSRLSEDLRAEFVTSRRRFSLLHRNGSNYRVSPGSERMVKIARFSP